MVMPLPYKVRTALEGVPLQVGPHVFLDRILNEDFSAFYKDGVPEYYKDMLTPSSTCIYVSAWSDGDFASAARRLATKTKFVLNNVIKGAPLLVPFCVLIESDGDAIIHDWIDIDPAPTPHPLRDANVEIPSTVDATSVVGFYELVERASAKKESLLFALERFNSSIAHALPEAPANRIYDSIVDMAISLESLIPGKDELRFRFSLSNAFAAEGDAARREQAFRRLRSLYDARSSIVHGEVRGDGRDADVEELRQDWPQVIHLAKACLTYYMMFVDERSPGDWDLHTRHLIMGLEKRVVD